MIHHMKHRTASADDLAGISWFNGLTDERRAYWLDQAGSAVPADAWSRFKSVRDAVRDAEPLPVMGRPVLPPDQKLKTVSIRLTDAQRRKLKDITQDRLRAWIDSYPLDPA
jgi:hypothetical protein